MRLRHAVLTIGSILVIAAFYLTDPDKGASTIATLLGTTYGFIAVALAHLSRVALFDYLDMQELLNKAKQSEVGAGLIFAGVCLVIYGLLGVFSPAKAQDVRTYIPIQAYAQLPVLLAEKKSGLTSIKM